MKIRIEIDDEKLEALAKRRAIPVRYAPEDVLEQVGYLMTEPGVTDGDIYMPDFGPVGRWEVV